METMTTVGGDERPLEDILNRLNDLSRAPRTIDLRQPPPVPVPEGAVERISPAEDALVDAAAAPSQVPTAPEPGDATIDLTAPEAAPPVTVAAPTVTPEIDAPIADPSPAAEPDVIARDHAPTAASARVEHDSRYGRNGAVAPTVVRQAPTPHNIPVLPVSVRQDEVDLAEHAPAGGRRWLMVLLLLVLVAGAAAALLRAL